MTSKADQKYFSVEMRGRDPKTCNHGWVNSKYICVFCGAKVCGSCGGEGYIVVPAHDKKFGEYNGFDRDQCPNEKCDRGFVA